MTHLKHQLHLIGGIIVPVANTSMDSDRHVPKFQYSWHLRKLQLVCCNGPARNLFFAFGIGGFGTSLPDE